MKQKELTMTNTSTKQRNDATTARSNNDAASASQALPFVFGLRRRALKQIERVRDEVDPAVGSYATD